MTSCENRQLWKREWGAPFFVHTGLTILEEFQFQSAITLIAPLKKKSQMQMVVILCSLKGERTILVNIYGPNRDNKLVDFYHSALKGIKINDFDTDNIIIGGDFNCPLNLILDKRGGNLMPR